eukprot:161297_1
MFRVTHIFSRSAIAEDTKAEISEEVHILLHENMEIFDRLDVGSVITAQLKQNNKMTTAQNVRIINNPSNPMANINEHVHVDEATSNERKDDMDEDSSSTSSESSDSDSSDSSSDDTDTSTSSESDTKCKTYNKIKCKKMTMNHYYHDKEKKNTKTKKKRRRRRKHKMKGKDKKCRKEYEPYCKYCKMPVLCSKKKNNQLDVYYLNRHMDRFHPEKPWSFICCGKRYKKHRWASLKQHAYSQKRHSRD